MSYFTMLLYVVNIHQKYLQIIMKKSLNKFDGIKYSKNIKGDLMTKELV